MTREEWKIYFRNQRKERGKGIASAKDLVNILHDLYDYEWTPTQQAFVNLVNRYQDKLSEKYFDQIEKWKPEAKEKAMRRLFELVYKGNPFLNLLDKKDPFKGEYLPIPVIYETTKEK